MDNMEKMMQQILARLDADREEEKAADRKDYQDFLAKIEEEDRQANQDFLTRMKAIFDDNRKKAGSDKENFWARMDAIHETKMAMLRCPSGKDKSLFWTDGGRQMETDTKENEAVLERQRVHDEETAIHSLKACRSETIECLETTEVRLEYEKPASGDNEATKKSEQDTEMMQSAEEHQDIPTENVAVMPVAKTRKRRRVRKSNAGRRGES
jgi:hypothetical protein